MFKKVWVRITHPRLSDKEIVGYIDAQNRRAARRKLVSGRKVWISGKQYVLLDSVQNHMIAVRERIRLDNLPEEPSVDPTPWSCAGSQRVTVLSADSGVRKQVSVRALARALNLP
jgi:hypothetical protein